MTAHTVRTRTPRHRASPGRRLAALAASSVLFVGCAAPGVSADDTAVPSATAEVPPDVSAAVDAVTDAGAVDTTVDDVLPGLLPSAPAPVTVRQLLSHTSGMPHYVEQLVPDIDAAIAGRDDVHSPRELVDIALQLPWGSAPGSAFHYTNAGYTVLGLMAEEVTEQSVSQLQESRVFEPVGMDATSDPVDASMPDDALRGYLSVNGDPVDLTEYEPSFWSFGASLISTAGDVSSLNAAVQRGDLVEPETLEQMRAIGAEGYGLGLLAAGDACGATPPDIVYGQRGNGFGYNAITLASADGERVVTVAYTGGSFDPASDPIFPAVNDVLIAGLASTCP